jgi:hypothetical protein
MSAEPELLRTARIPVPRLPFPAILFFAVAGLGGALFLTYTSSFPAAEPIKAAASPTASAPVYSVPAVPFDANPDTVAAHAITNAQAVTATRNEPPQRTDAADPASDSASSEPVLFAEASRKFKGFNRFSQFGGANNVATLNTTTFGMIAQTNAPVYIAPDADSISAPVPEPSTWLCGVALLALLLVRGLHASWHRHHRRTANKTNSGRD